MARTPDDYEAAMGFLNGALALALIVQAPVQLEAPGDRIYGRVHTQDGTQLEGFLIWNGDKALWADFLEGRRAIPWSHVHEAERLDEGFRRRRRLERSISLPGVRISWDEDDLDDPLTAASAVAFGHLRSMEFLDRRRVLLRLRSGEVVNFTVSGEGGGTAAGRVIVLDPEGGQVEVRWRDLGRVDFTDPPEAAEAPSANRIMGTLRTRSGVELRGFVTWDGHGVLTNDVDSGSRAVEISVPGMGRAIVSSGAFASFTPEGAPRSGPWASRLEFDGGRPLKGVVETRGGARYAGRIRWGIDEGSTWETIEGSSDGVEYELELGSVRRLSRAGASAARVALNDGRELFLERGGGMGGEGPGLFVRLQAGRTVLVRWRDLARVTLDGG